jgi:hypothetical protein
MRMVAFPRPAFTALIEREGLRVASVSTRRRGRSVSCTYLAVRPGA